MLLGFVGVGAMGGPMAGHLMEAGHELVVHDAGSVQGLDGAWRSSSPREVADLAEVVFVCVPDARALKAVVLGADGIQKGAAARIIVHTGTSGPEVLDEIAVVGPAQQIIDAPITGGVPRAQAGTLTSIVAGPRPARQEIRPLIDTYSRTIVDMGERAGDAQRAKLVNNILSAANLALACEAIVLARKLDLDLESVLEVINAGSGQNSATLTKIPENVLPRQFNRGGRIEMLLKDIDAAREVAIDADVPMPLVDMVRAVFARAIEEDGPGGDSTSVVRHMERAAGLGEGPSRGVAQ